MKFSNEKKQAIILYLLKKISDGAKSLSKVVADAFNISQNTVHAYINELIENNIIEKGKRGQYELVTEIFTYNFKRSQGDLENETRTYEICLKQHIDTLSKNIRHIWSYAFSEMVNNVIDHSEAENMQVVVMKNQLQTRVLIIDDGVGIFEKIKSHFSLPSLDEAICELFKGKLTTDELRHSGEGIFFTSKMMDTFFIRSSKKVFAFSNFSKDIIEDMDKFLQGTLVFMALSNFTKKSAREVFDLYSNSEGAFNKTRIPLKNVFDSAPVSRSQAKRVYNRLDEFQEIILDFDSVSWMGQGFAHELFVVCKNLHPNVKLIPVNMNEGVTNMYNHVMSSAEQS